MPALDLRASNLAEASTLAGMETDEPESNPNNGEEVIPHFASSRGRTDLADPSPRTPPWTLSTSEEASRRIIGRRNSTAAASSTKIIAAMKTGRNPKRD